MKKRDKVLSILMAIVLLATCIFVPAAAAEEGTIPEGYIPIYTAEDLNAVRDNLSGNYILMNSIEFSEADFAKDGAFYADGNGWAPIGNESDPFTGTFDGNGYQISGLRINGDKACQTGAAALGLFGYNGGTIKNLDFEGAISAASDCYVEDGVKIGGIAGENTGRIENCVNRASIVAKIFMPRPSGSEYHYGRTLRAGGIAGWNTGSIYDCQNQGAIDASSVAQINEYDYSSHTFLGGIAGQTSGEIVRCENSADLLGAKVVNGYKCDDACVGGIVGSSWPSGVVDQCLNTGKVECPLQIKNWGTNIYCLSKVGGILGQNNGTVTNSRNVGSVEGYWYVGGIAGQNNASISTTYNAGDVISRYTMGGIAAINQGTVSKCYNDSLLNASRATIAGGIIGENKGTVSNCYNTKDITLTAYAKGDMVGGIIGKNSNQGKLSSCYNLGRAYAQSIPDDVVAYIGGIAGYQLADISLEDCYFRVSNLASGDVGVGYGKGSPVRCVDLQMKEQANYVGFDFDEVWTIDPGAAYPYPTLRDMTMEDGRIAGIEIISNPNKTTYKLGESLNLEGLVVTARYTNGYIKTITDYTVSGFDSSVEGLQWITISYQGESASFAVSVRSEDSELKDMLLAAMCYYAQSGIVTDPAQLNYNQAITAQNLDPIIMRMVFEKAAEDALKAFRAPQHDVISEGIPQSAYLIPTDDMQSWISSAYTSSNADLKNSRFYDNKGNLLVYLSGYGVGADDARFEISKNEEGNWEVHFETTDEALRMFQRTDFEVTSALKIKKLTLDTKETGFSIKNLPDKTEYVHGEALDVTGGIAAIEYDNGLTTDLPLSQCSIRGYDPKILGEQTVYVTYFGRDTQFTVKVVPAPRPETGMTAYDQNGNPLTEVNVNEWFDVEVITDSDVKNIKLYNEYGLKLVLTDLTRSDNQNGTDTWRFRLYIGTKGIARTLTLATVDQNNIERLTDKTLVLDVLPLNSVVYSAKVTGEVKRNEKFEITVETNQKTQALRLYNEYGMKLSWFSCTHQDIGDKRIWTICTAVGTAGMRYFEIYGVDTIGKLGNCVKTNTFFISA